MGANGRKCELMGANGSRSKLRPLDLMGTNRTKATNANYKK
jgi:hypothetical protein